MSRAGLPCNPVLETKLLEFIPPNPGYTGGIICPDIQRHARLLGLVHGAVFLDLIRFIFQTSLHFENHRQSRGDFRL